MAAATRHDIEQLLRLMCWERIKGEIMGMLHTWSTPPTGPGRDQYDEIANLSARFIDQIDDAIS